MNQKAISQWRTVGTVVVLAGLMVLCLLLVADKPRGPELLGEVGWAFVLFAGVAAGKSAVEHLAVGGGLRGALNAFLTDAKPGDPPAGGAP